MFLQASSNDKMSIIYAKSVIRGILLSIILLILGALVFYFTSLNQDYIETFVWIVSILSICYASIYGTFKIGHKGFIHGAILGAIYTAVIAIIAILAERGQLDMKSYLIMLVMSIVIGALSGMIGITLSGKK